MVRQTRQSQPNPATPSNQALVTPYQASPNDLVSALQQQTNQQSMAQVQRDIGALQAEINNIKVSLGATSKDVSDLTRLAHQLRGTMIGGGLILTLFISVIGYFAGSKFNTLLKMADIEQVREAEASENDKKAALAKP